MLLVSVLLRTVTDYLCRRVLMSISRICSYLASSPMSYVTSFSVCSITQSLTQ
jgi:hypothetical protein